MLEENRNVLLAMSGGVDSSTSAILLKNKGYNVIGVTFKMFHSDNRSQNFQKGIRDAKMLASKLGIPLYIIDIVDIFNNEVVSYFLNSYKTGKTPNPCAFCNHKIKWSKLLEIADSFNCKYVATGHYAAIKEKNGRLYISEANDRMKDQSFFLWRLTQEQLKRTIFPLSSYSKSTIKNMAKEKGFKVLAKKSESYNICFIPDGDYRSFINRFLTNTKGEILLENGELIGEHSGIWNYTIGQKQGFNNPKGELCVEELDYAKNTVIVGDYSSIQTREVKINEVNFQKEDKFDEKKQYHARISYRGELKSCKINSSENEYTVVFEKPVVKLAPGQSILFFEESDLIAGAVISS